MNKSIIKSIKDKLLVLLFAVSLAFVISSASTSLIYTDDQIHNADIVNAVDLEAGNILSH